MNFLNFKFIKNTKFIILIIIISLIFSNLNTKVTIAGGGGAPLCFNNPILFITCGVVACLLFCRKGGGPSPPPPPDVKCKVNQNLNIVPSEGSLTTNFQLQYTLEAVGEPNSYSYACQKCDCSEGSSPGEPGPPDQPSSDGPGELPFSSLEKLFRLSFVNFRFPVVITKEIVDSINKIRLDLKNLKHAKAVTTLCSCQTQTFTETLTPSCIFTGYSYVKLNQTVKDWGYTVQNSSDFPEKRENINSSSFSKSYRYIPNYHGRHQFEYGYQGNVEGVVNFSCPSGWTLVTPPLTQGPTPVSSSKSTELLVSPTNVISLAPNSTSRIPHPSNVITQLRDFIVNFPITTNYGVSLGPPGVFKKDALPDYPSSFWLEIVDPNGRQRSSSEVSLNEPFTYQGRSSSYSWTPTIAGDYLLRSCHKADDEASVSPNLECDGSSITVYRYLCYQGFCWECSKEPTLSGGFINLQSGNCKTVEPAKCQAYINSDCKVKGRE